MRLALYCLLLASFAFVSCGHKETLFTSLPASSTHIDFVNNLEKKTCFQYIVLPILLQWWRGSHRRYQ